MPTTLAQNAYVDVNDLVTLTNDGDTPWEGTYESRDYSCQPGKSIFIPFFLAVKDFGDPRSQPGSAQRIVIRGVSHFIPNRESEVARLCTKYGILDNVVGTGLAQKAPKVTLKDQAGNEIVPVVQDLKGQSYLPSTEIQINERDMLEARLAQLQSQLNALGDRLPSEDEPAEDIDEDLPPDYSTGFRQ